MRLNILYEWFRCSIANCQSQYIKKVNMDPQDVIVPRNMFAYSRGVGLAQYAFSDTSLSEKVLFVPLVWLLNQPNHDGILAMTPTSGNI